MNHVQPLERTSRFSIENTFLDLIKEARDAGLGGTRNPSSRALLIELKALCHAHTYVNTYTQSHLGEKGPLLTLEFKAVTHQPAHGFWTIAGHLAKVR